MEWTDDVTGLDEASPVPEQHRTDHLFDIPLILTYSNLAGPRRAQRPGAKGRKLIPAQHAEISQLLDL